MARASRSRGAGDGPLHPAQAQGGDTHRFGMWGGPHSSAFPNQYEADDDNKKQHCGGRCGVGKKT